MLNVLERFPLGNGDSTRHRALHFIIERRSWLRGLVRYVGDPPSAVPVASCSARSAPQSGGAHRSANRCVQVEPTQLASVTDAKGELHHLPHGRDRDGNIARSSRSNYSGFGSGLVPKDKGFMCQPRGPVTLEPGPDTCAPQRRCTPSFPASSRRESKIGSHHGGCGTRPGARQFVANVVTTA